MFSLKRCLFNVVKYEEILIKGKSIGPVVKYATARNEKSQEEEFLEFRVLQVRPVPQQEREKRPPPKANPPRTKLMKTDQDWPSVWPGPRTFHPASVPLPLRQGANKKGVSPDKYCNLELMKIPNFLHLTPEAIRRHCEAIKKFCTQWPENLDTDEDMEKHFPVEVITSDYCHSSPTIRDPLSRIVTLKVKLSSLNLDEHARDKFLRLIGPRYNPETDVITITTENCPRRHQNYDYAHYLLTASYYESWKKENWEDGKVDEDQETYIWAKRQSSRNVEAFFNYNNREKLDTSEYALAVENLINQGDSEETLRKYKEASLKLLSLPKWEEVDT